MTYPTQEYKWFSSHVLDEHDITNHQLLIDHYAEQLTIDPDSWWVYASENSICLAFRTTRPCYAHVNTVVGRTDPEEWPHTVHLFQIGGLLTGHIYTLEVHCVDSTGKTITKSLEIVTWNNPNRVYIDDTTPLPLIIKQPGLYVLKSDLCAPRRAFTVTAPDVFLDLNGHIVTYDAEEPSTDNEPDWSNYPRDPTSSFGCFICYTERFTLCNGTLQQGAHGGTGCIGIGFNPVYVQGNCENIEIAGMRFLYRGNGVGGLLLGYSTEYNIHHNVVEDHGCGISNRHQGIRAIAGVAKSSQAVRYNRISRCRQLGIDVRAPAIGNEIGIDSYATNSFGLAASVDVRDNHIYGTGEYPIGLSWGGGTGTYRHNYISLYGQHPATPPRWTEDTGHGNCVGVRLTQYMGETNLYQDYVYEQNVIVLRGVGGQTLRGFALFSDPNVINCVVRNNVVAVWNLDGVVYPGLWPADSRLGHQSCIVAHGNPATSDQHTPILYEDNLLISNYCCVRLGDTYGRGSNAIWRHNTFRAVGPLPQFAWIHNVDMGYDTFGHRFIDTVLDPPTIPLDKPFFPHGGTGLCEYSVGFTAHVVVYYEGHIVQNELVRIWRLARSESSITGEGVTDNNGRCDIELLEYAMSVQRGKSTIEKTSYLPLKAIALGLTVDVVKGGDTIIGQVVPPPPPEPTEIDRLEEELEETKSQLAVCREVHAASEREVERLLAEWGTCKGLLREVVEMERKTQEWYQKAKAAGGGGDVLAGD